MSVLSGVDLNKDSVDLIGEQFWTSENLSALSHLVEKAEQRSDGFFKELETKIYDKFLIDWEKPTKTISEAIYRLKEKQEIRVRPLNRIVYALFHYFSAHGEYMNAWEASGEIANVNIILKFAACASVHVIDANPAVLLEGRRALQQEQLKAQFRAIFNTDNFQQVNQTVSGFLAFLGGSREGFSRLLDTFFSTDDVMKIESHSRNFTCYRWHTQRRKIAQSFMVINALPSPELEFMTFAHFWADELTNVHETQGIIVPTAKKFYFLGGKNPLQSMALISASYPVANSERWIGLIQASEMSDQNFSSRIMLEKTDFGHSNQVAKIMGEGEFLASNPNAELILGSIENKVDVSINEEVAGKAFPVRSGDLSVNLQKALETTLTDQGFSVAASSMARVEDGGLYKFNAPLKI